MNLSEEDDIIFCLPSLFISLLLCTFAVFLLRLLKFSSFPFLYNIYIRVVHVGGFSRNLRLFESFIKYEFIYEKSRQSVHVCRHCKYCKRYRRVFKSRADNNFVEFILSLRISNINIMQGIERLFKRVSRP
jgi:hypothetical protein